MKSKNIEAFVRRSIKADTADITELHLLLDQMSAAEMQQFWMHFAANRAFSTASTAVPHWKTKEQEVCFQHEHMSWIFYPKEKDASGKFIVVRKDLEEHITAHLIRHIDSERAYRTRFRTTHHRRPFGFYVALVFVAIFVGVVVLARLDTGNWSTGAAILCLGAMALAIFTVSAAFYAIEGAYYRRNRRRQDPKDQTP